MDSLDWIKKQKKITINSINKKHYKCFQFAVKAVLNHEKMKKDLQRIMKIKPSILSITKK